MRAIVPQLDSTSRTFGVLSFLSACNFLNDGCPILVRFVRGACPERSRRGGIPQTPPLSAAKNRHERLHRQRSNREFPPPLGIRFRGPHRTNQRPANKSVNSAVPVMLSVLCAFGPRLRRRSARPGSSLGESASTASYQSYNSPVRLLSGGT
jgi:hypothetical protein